MTGVQEKIVSTITEVLPKDDGGPNPNNTGGDVVIITAPPATSKPQETTLQIEQKMFDFKFQ